ncbi:hypothetical protein MKEN_00497300 [Mycena kentingensis (nom. inval.)]|nr:hypothetical protein MKEN_00497300 [Mycena kentingensis (nom. inval.)]
MASSEAASVLISALVALCVVYAVSSPFFKTPRQAAWILSTVASGTMTVWSIPFVGDYLVGGVDGVKDRAALAVAMNRVFQAYLIADLAVGSLSYCSQITLLTGWVHHVAYVAICETAIRNGWAHIFALAALMELPTFILGIGTLFPKLRSNRLFAAAFFTTRICLHLVLLFTYALPAHRPNASVAPALILASVFPLHAMWFTGCVKGFLRRARERKLMRHPLAADVHTDARSLARHASTTAVVPPWDVTLRLRRLRARVSYWVHAKTGPGTRWASARRPIRPRAMARRMSESIVGVLPSPEAVMEFVGLR